MNAVEALTLFDRDLREKIAQKASWGKNELKDLIHDIHLKLLNQIANEQLKEGK